MQFFWAYVANGNVAFDPDVHAVKDERVYGFDFSHNENEFALLTLDIRNPRIGLLNDSRMQWLWASYQIAEEEPTPFFFGRLVGMPENLQEEILTIVYRAEPNDYDDQKLALAETLKEFPYWDQVFINPEFRDDPDAVLEARPVRWHIDPVTHEVTVSHIINGDTTVNIETDAHYMDTLKFGYGAPPLASVKVIAEVAWDQVGSGSVNLRRHLLDAFAAAGSPGGTITSLTGQGLEKSWPRPGDRIGGGWCHGVSVLGSPSIPGLEGETVGFASQTRFEQGTTYWKGSAAIADLVRFGFGDGDEWEYVQVPVIEETEEEQNIFEVRFYFWKFGMPHFNVAYNASRRRTEVLTFTLFGDTQPILTAAQGQDQINVRSDLISEESDITGEGSPIGDNRKSSYFDTDRGKQSLEYLIALAVHRLLLRARMVKMQLEVPFSKVLEASTRKNALIIDSRLPGGQAGGKITGYGFRLEGSTGKLTCLIAAEGCVGRGEVLPAPTDGTPEHVEVDYGGTEYQRMIGRQIAALDESVAYDDYIAALDDDGLNFFDMSPSSVIAGSRAENTIWFTALPSVDDEITIGNKTYVWKAVVGAANTIVIGSTTDECVYNLGATILAIENLAGVTFGVGTLRHSQVSPRMGETMDRLVVVAREHGPSGNSIAVSIDGSYAVREHATLLGGAVSPAGLRVINGPELQRDVLERAIPPTGIYASPTDGYMDINAVIEELNKFPTKVRMELVPVVGGPFNTDYEITVSELMIPKTVDLEAESEP